MARLRVPLALTTFDIVHVAPLHIMISIVTNILFSTISHWFLMLVCLLFFIQYSPLVFAKALLSSDKPYGELRDFRNAIEKGSDE